MLSRTRMGSGIDLHYSNYLAHMAALIKQNPSITVREIAAELKFADAKSVYYWLEKGKFKGINEFKRQVLGQEGPFAAPIVVDVAGKTHYLVTLPLFSWNPQEKKPVDEWYHLHNHPEPHGLFAVRVGTSKYSPWFWENDVLIIAETALKQLGEWVLYRAGEHFIIARRINGTALEPNTLQPYPQPLTPVGMIIGQQRFLQR